MRTLRADSEAGFQAQVLELAVYGGWIYYHPPDNKPIKSRTGRVYLQRVTPGFPDLVLVRAPELIFAELKTDTGRVKPEQDAWLTALHLCGQEVVVWRPRDWPQIEQRLAIGDPVA